MTKKLEKKVMSKSWPSLMLKCWPCFANFGRVHGQDDILNFLSSAGRMNFLGSSNFNMAKILPYSMHLKQNIYIYVYIHM